jgi:two-component system response regulator LytT
MNIVIIEDELLTAEDLADMISQLGEEMHITAVLHSVKEACRYLNEAPAVDLIFSDIQLGDGLSFEIFRSTRVDAPIIFCTAYDEYALDAIRNNGIDYILKPYTAESIQRAIAKYDRLKKLFVPADIDYEKLIRSITGVSKPDNEASSILVYYKDKILPVGFDEIALCYVEGEFVRLHCFNGKSYIVSQALDELEKLAKGGFFRVNRQYLVNRQAVLDANHYPPRKYIVNLSISFKEVLVVSKNRTATFLQWLTRK